MLSVASSHCILTTSRDFYRNIRRRLEWKILVATLKLKRLDWTWSGQVDLMAATVIAHGVQLLTHSSLPGRNHLCGPDMKTNRTRCSANAEEWCKHTVS